MTTATATENALCHSHVSYMQAFKGIVLGSLSGDLKDEHVIHQITPSLSHIIWQMGHISHAIDGLAHVSHGRPSVVPASYEELFRSSTQPTADASQYPSLDELKQTFESAMDKTIAAVEGMTDGQLLAPLPEDSPLSGLFGTATMDNVLHFLNFHTGYHVGQISMLRRVQDLPTGYGY